MKYKSNYTKFIIIIVCNNCDKFVGIFLREIDLGGLREGVFILKRRYSCLAAGLARQWEKTKPFCNPV